MIEHRLAAIEKALARAARLGIRVDEDPVFHGLLAKWADGSISMKDARAAYLDHIRERDQARADWRALGIQSSIAQLRAKRSR